MQSSEVSYDVRHVPPAVYEAILRLMQTLMDAFPTVPGSGLVPRTPTVPAPPPPEDQQAVRDPLPVPMVVSCPHGTATPTGCLECTVLHQAEAVLAEVQTDSRQRFPRSAVELRILDMVEQLAPLPVTPRQIAVLLGLHPEQVRLVLQELATLGTVAHPDLGYDRYKGTEAGETPHLDGPFPPDRPAPLTWQKQEVLATLRTAFPRVCSPAELEREIRIVQARPTLCVLTVRGQVERLAHDRYRYRSSG